MSAVDLSAQAAADLATNYFAIANAATAFYIAQKLLFLNALYKETKLSEAIRTHWETAEKTTWRFAQGYALVITLICGLEAWLRCIAQQGWYIVFATSLAWAGRLAIIFLSAKVSSGILKLIGKNSAKTGSEGNP